MKEVYYKGEPYEYQMVESKGKRQFHLYKNGVLMHNVEQCELDIKSIVSLILDAYYRSAKSNVQTRVAP
ncbi:MAG TPA: hypothetical protein VEB86_19380 [Chryseosolibacter sp.]|nr:hypothetical protein [Chryseosolibacter sp.]